MKPTEVVDWFFYHLIKDQYSLFHQSENIYENAQLAKETQECMPASLYGCYDQLNMLRKYISFPY